MSCRALRLCVNRLLTLDIAEFAFYVNKNGWRAKQNWIIQWEGFPSGFGESAST